MKFRTPIVAGNWKMHNTIVEALDLAKALHFGMVCPPDVDVVIAPTFVAVHEVAKLLEGSFIKVAGQDLFWEDTGAYTGEVSGMLLKDAGADYVIIGHSERRQYFNETDATVNKKVKAALKNALIPIVCVGETLAQRETGQAQEVVTFQTKEGLQGLTPAEIADLVIAYEPVWAIGTGKTATAQQAEEMHVVIRNVISQQFGPDAADKIRILYGGSVKAANSAELLNKPNIDGALVGGASLKAKEFIDIIHSINA